METSLHSCSPSISIEGRAIVIPLHFLHTDHVPRPHMAVLFYPNKVTEDGFDIAEHRLKVWLAQHEYKPVRFSLSPWGMESYLVHGELEELGNFIREVFKKQDRPLHVRLRDRQRMDAAASPVDYMLPPPYSN